MLRLSERNRKRELDIIFSYVLIASGSVQAFSLPKDDPVIDFQSTIEDTNTVCPFAITKSKDVLLFGDNVRFPLSLMESAESELAGVSPAEMHLQREFPAVDFSCKCLYETKYGAECATDAAELAIGATDANDENKSAIDATDANDANESAFDATESAV